VDCLQEQNTLEEMLGRLLNNTIYGFPLNDNNMVLIMQKTNIISFNMTQTQKDIFIFLVGEFAVMVVPHKYLDRWQPQQFQNGECQPKDLQDLLPPSSNPIQLITSIGLCTTRTSCEATTTNQGNILQKKSTSIGLAVAVSAGTQICVFSTLVLVLIFYKRRKVVKDYHSVSLSQREVSVAPVTFNPLFEE